MVSLPSIGVLQVGGLGSSLKIVKSDSISTSKLVEICCPNRVVNQQHFVERNLIVFCLKGMWHSKRGDFENQKQTFCLDNLDNVARFQLKCWSIFQLHVTCCNKISGVPSCSFLCFHAMICICLDLPQPTHRAKRFEAYQRMRKKRNFHNGAGGTWITWHESIDRISAGNIRAF